MTKIIMLVFLHIIGDSVLQSQKLRQQKIERILPLFKHVGIYTLVLLIFVPILLRFTLLQTLYFSFINAVLHLITDWIFIKIKKHYWDNGDYKYVAAFSIFEHLIHVSILIAVMVIMVPNSIDVSSWLDHFIILIQSR